MTTTTKVIIGVAAAAAIGGGIFWAYKKHPEWFGKTASGGIVSSPNQGSPAIATPTQSKLQSQAQSAAGVVSAGKSIVDSILG